MSNGQATFDTGSIHHEKFDIYKPWSRFPRYGWEIEDVSPISQRDFVSCEQNAGATLRL